jgi:hypothetical protein
VPFDRPYAKLFDALVYTVHDCGCIARCAKESDDGSQVRLEKLYGIIEESRFGIHDLSRVTLDSKNHLPRFNMPLELGIFLGAKRYGSARQRQKAMLILEKEPYRLAKFCSDLAGQDPRAHGNDLQRAITIVPNWLRTERSGVPDVPGGAAIALRYFQFRRDLPGMCELRQLNIRDLTFLDYRTLVEGWLDAHQ